MRGGMRLAALTGAAVLGASGVLIAPASAQAAPTASAWVTSFAIMYEAGTAQSNSVSTAKVVTSTGQWLWQFTDVVPITAGAGCHHPTRDLSVVWCAPGGALAIGIRTFDLNDTIKVGSPNTTVYAGSGNDTVYTPHDPSVQSWVYGEDGDDIVVSGTSKDNVHGGPGMDTISYQNRLGPICVDLTGWSSPPGGNPRIGNSTCEVDDREDLYLDTLENAIGGWNDDFIWGNSLDNRLKGGPGEDEIHGTRGHDMIFGGPGNDYLYGGSGDGYDLVYGEDGADILVDWAGQNYHSGGSGYDDCTGAMVKVECEE